MGGRRQRPRAYGLCLLGVKRVGGTNMRYNHTKNKHVCTIPGQQWERRESEMKREVEVRRKKELAVVGGGQEPEGPGRRGTLEEQLPENKSRCIYIS